MKVDVKKVDPTLRELKFEIPKERVDKKLDEVYEEITKIAKIKGFRPGKAPRQMIESTYSGSAKEEMLKKLIPEVYQEAIEQEGLIPLDMPEIDEVSFKDGKLLFKATLDIRPEITIKDYKGLKVTRKPSEVTEDEVLKTLDYFKQGKGKDGAEVAIDDAFAHGLGFPSLEDLKKSMRRQLEMDKERHNRIDLENQIIEELLKKAKLVVPQSLVKKQLERRVQDMQKRMKQQGMKDEDIQKKDEEIRKNLKDAVEKDIKVYLILDKIAVEEKIELKENENMPAKIIEFLLKEAKWEEK